MVWTLIFDGHPPSPNDRLHWRKRAKLTKHWRTLAKVEAQRQVIPPMKKIKLSVVIYRRNLGVADEDNDRGRTKGILDGIVDAGVVPNDTRGEIIWGPVDEAKWNGKKKQIKIMIEEAA